MRGGTQSPEGKEKRNLVRARGESSEERGFERFHSIFIYFIQSIIHVSISGHFRLTNTSKAVIYNSDELQNETGNYVE